MLDITKLTHRDLIDLYSEAVRCGGYCPCGCSYCEDKNNPRRHELLEELIKRLEKDE